MHFWAFMFCFCIPGSVMALPLSHFGRDGQLNSSRGGISLKARSQAGAGGEGHNEWPDWASKLLGEERANYERLKATHDRWKRSDPELWGSFQECQRQIPADAAPAERLWLVHQCTMDVLTLAIERTGRRISDLNEELERNSASKNLQKGSVQDSSPPDGSPENDEQAGRNNNKLGQPNLKFPGSDVLSKLNFHLNVPANSLFSKVKSNLGSSLRPVKFLPPGGFRPQFYIP